MSADTGVGPSIASGSHAWSGNWPDLDRKSTRLNSSHANISYAVFCLKKKKNSFSFSSFLDASTENLYWPASSLAFSDQPLRNCHPHPSFGISVSVTTHIPLIIHV